MRRVLESIGSSAVDLIDKILKLGYLDPPDDYTYHGFYRVNLTSGEKEFVRKELQRSWDDQPKSSIQGHHEARRMSWHIAGSLLNIGNAPFLKVQSHGKLQNNSKLISICMR